MPADPQPDAALSTPSPERGVGSSDPIRPTGNWKGEEVGPDGLTADQRAWIQKGHDDYDNLLARGNYPQLLPESSPAW